MVLNSLPRHVVVIKRRHVKIAFALTVKWKSKKENSRELLRCVEKRIANVALDEKDVDRITE